MSKMVAYVRPLAAPILALLLHATALRVLVALDVVGRILGAAATPPLGLLVVVALFYVLRLCAYFVVPGWLLLRMIHVVGTVITNRR